MLSCVLKSFWPIDERSISVCASSHFEPDSGSTVAPRVRASNWWPKQIPANLMSGRVFHSSVMRDLSLRIHASEPCASYMLPVMRMAWTSEGIDEAVGT